MASPHRDVTSHNLSVNAPPANVRRNTSGYQDSFLNFPPVTGMREPGTAYMTVWTAPTPNAGVGDPRIAGERARGAKGNR